MKQIEGSLQELRVVTMSTGDRLLCRDTAVYVPAAERANMLSTLHLTHASDVSMLANAKDWIYWPGLRGQLRETYLKCKECSLFRISQTRPTNEVSFQKLLPQFILTGGLL